MSKNKSNIKGLNEKQYKISAILIIFFGFLCNFFLLQMVSGGFEETNLPFSTVDILHQKSDVINSKTSIDVSLYQGSAGYIFPIKIPKGTKRCSG